MKQISVNRIEVRPYDSNSDIAIDYPGYDYFDFRSDFVLRKSMEALAVVIYYSFGDDFEHDHVELPVTVRIFDKTSRCSVAEQSLMLILPEDELFMKVRVDLPLTYKQVNPNHDYEVRVCENRRTLVRHDLRFFKFLLRFRKNYTVEYAFLKSNGKEYQNYSGSEETEVVFRVSKNSEMCKRHPEFYLHLHDANNYERNIKCECDFETDEDGYYKSSFTVRARLNMVELPYGITFFALKMLRAPIASIVFDSTFQNVEGRFIGKDTEYITFYSREKGADIIHRRGWEEKSDPFINDDDEYYDPDLEDDEEEEAADNSCITIGNSKETDSSEAASEQEEEPAPATVSAREKLDAMIGLKEVKSRVKDYCQLMLFAKQRREAGLTFGHVPLHALFLGSPGTGKTTVAKIMGQMLHEVGILSKGHVVVRERSMLTGMHYGDEESKTLEAIEEAQGGILFIDEAYQLHQPHDPKDPGHFVLDTLMTALADENKRDWMLIMAGYTDETKHLLDLNPGLTSRIPESNLYNFEDYNPTELLEIAQSWLARNQYILTPHATEVLRKRLEADYAVRGKDFGNGRHVMNIIETGILHAMAARVSSIANPTTDDLQLIHACDIPPHTDTKKEKRRVIGFTA